MNTCRYRVRAGHVPCMPGRLCPPPTTAAHTTSWDGDLARSGLRRDPPHPDAVVVAPAPVGSLAPRAPERRVELFDGQGLDGIANPAPQAPFDVLPELHHVCVRRGTRQCVRGVSLPAFTGPSS